MSYVTQEEFAEYKKTVDKRFGSKGKKVKDPNKTKRPPSAYNLYMKSELPKIKKKNHEMSHSDAFTAVARSWGKVKTKK